MFPSTSKTAAWNSVLTDFMYEKIIDIIFTLLRGICLGLSSKPLKRTRDFFVATNPVVNTEHHQLLFFGGWFEMKTIEPFKNFETSSLSKELIVLDSERKGLLVKYVVPTVGLFVVGVAVLVYTGIFVRDALRVQSMSNIPRFVDSQFYQQTLFYKNPLFWILALSALGFFIGAGVYYYFTKKKMSAYGAAYKHRKERNRTVRTERKKI